MTAERRRSRQLKPLAAGAFQGTICSFRLYLAAEGKAAKTVRMYAEAVQWFAAAHLLRETSRADWDQVSAQDIQRWMVWLLGRYSYSYASSQYRALQQFFRWWSEEEEEEEEELPDPMARLRQPPVSQKLAARRRTCQGLHLRQSSPGYRAQHARGRIRPLVPMTACPS
jgi:integrase/recombinase XerD